MVIVYKLGSKVSNLSRGKTNNVLGELSGLEIPFKNDTVTVVVGAVCCHMVIFLKLSLSATKGLSGDVAFLVETDLGLDCIIKSSNNLAVCNYCSCDIRVNLNCAVSFLSILRAVIVGVDSKTESELALALELNCLVVIASLNDSISEISDLHSAACSEKLLISRDVMIVYELNGKVLNFFYGHTDNVFLEELSLLEPFKNDTVMVVIAAPLGHIVVVEKLLLSLELCGNGNETVSNVNLVLSNVNTAEYNLAVLVKNYGSNGCINLCSTGLGALKAYYCTHTKCVLVFRSIFL